MRPISETQLQNLIVDALQLAGLTVYHTSAFKQKGASGVSKGIPDLLVVHPQIQCCFIGIEVKRPGPIDKIRWSSPEQKEGYYSKHFHLAQSPEDALRAVIASLVHGDGRIHWQNKIGGVLRGLGSVTVSLTEADLADGGELQSKVGSAIAEAAFERDILGGGLGA